MRRSRSRPARGLAVLAVPWCLVAALSGCSGAPSARSSPAGASRPATVHSIGPSRSAHPKTVPVITVSGDRPVVPNGSQDTHAQTPGDSCGSATFATDRAVGARVAAGFAAAGFPAAAGLLTHFLRGAGTGVG